MPANHTVLVRFVDGSSGMAPFAVRENRGGTFLLLPTPEFDPEDTSRLFEFLPGDVILTTSAAQREGDESEPAQIATELVESSALDRDYWWVLFNVAYGLGKRLDLPTDALRSVARRICAEVNAATRWHYAEVISWARGICESGRPSK
jgi:hypothetical protein